jgi:ABC-type lipoprotein export system ATPase subunit
MNDHSIIRLCHISYEVKLHHPSPPLVLFKDLFWKIAQGTAHVIQGISGSGKSTLLSLLAGFQQPTRGTIYYDDVNLVQCREAQKAQVQRKIGFVFQQPFLLSELSVIENVMMKELLHGTAYDVCRSAAERLLQNVGLAHRADDPIDGLSGGEQQRISLARALCGNPAFLLLDEPTAHLDVASKLHMMEILKQVQAEASVGLVITTHDEEIAALFKHVWYIHDQALHPRN